MVSVDEHGSRRIALADFFEHSAILHLRKAAPAKFSRCGHAQNTGVRQTMDEIARNVRMPIDPVRIELAVQHLPNLSQRALQLRFLSGGEPGVRHHPISNEISVE